MGKSMGQEKLLEVLIPTYNRTESAISAIESVISTGEERVGVFCHSNGADPKLQNFALRHPKVRYGCYSENKGAVANFLKILQESKAEYVIFLSDEDRINADNLAEFLSFLSRRKYAFVHCSVIESNGASYFPLNALHDQVLSKADLLRLFTIDPTYLSGYCFRRELLTPELLTFAFDANEANVYPHLLLRNCVVDEEDVIGLFAPSLIVKGEEANIGGDSHSHLDGNASKADMPRSKRLLNPRIYGEEARMKQLIYLLPMVNKAIQSLCVFDRLFISLYILAAWLKITNDAHAYVEASMESMQLKAAKHQGDSIKGAVLKAYLVVLKIRYSSVRKIVISTLWNFAKLLKLFLFIYRFGLFRAFDYVKMR